MARKKPTAARSNDPVPFAATVIRQVPIGELAAYSANPREHPEEQVEQLVELIRRFGFTDPVLFRDGVLVAGHGRLEAARRLELATVPGIDLDHLTAEQARELRVAHNRVSDRSTWNVDALSAELEAIQRAGGDLALIGFTQVDLERLMRDLEAAGTPPVVDELADENGERPPVVARNGELWVLGDHRVICGDARDRAAWAALFAGDKGGAAVIHTDPPYGISYESAGSGARVRNDDLVGDALVGLLSDSFAAALEHARVDAAWYVWHAGGTLREDVALAMRNATLVELQYLVWAKPTPNLGRADYQWAHEACFYAARQDQRPRWFGGRDQGTVWRIGQRSSDATALVLGSGVVVQSGTGHQVLVTPVPARAAKTRRARALPDAPVLIRQEQGDGTLWEIARDHNPEHPTQKPVELVTRALLNSSQVGELVADPFGGGGSTLLGCERIGRRARLVELEAAWVDLIIRRWQAATGRAAVLGDDGRTWADIALERAASKRSRKGTGRAKR